MGLCVSLNVNVNLYSASSVEHPNSLNELAPCEENRFQQVPENSFSNFSSAYEVRTRSAVVVRRQTGNGKSLAAVRAESEQRYV